jgi:hypothetical protein
MHQYCQFFRRSVTTLEGDVICGASIVQAVYTLQIYIRGMQREKNLNCTERHEEWICDAIKYLLHHAINTVRPDWLRGNDTTSATEYVYWQ